MRRLDRLIEVMRSLNPEVIGDTVSDIFEATANHLECDLVLCYACEFNMNMIAMHDPSPHLRELAEQALAYHNGNHTKSDLGALR